MINACPPNIQVELFQKWMSLGLLGHFNAPIGINEVA